LSVKLKHDDSTKIGENLYRFEADLPCGEDVQQLRFDPVWDEGQVIIKDLKYRTYKSFDVDLENEFYESMKILNGIRKFELVEDGIFIESTGNDPFVELCTDLTRYTEPGLLFFLKTWMFSIVSVFLTLRVLRFSWHFFVANIDSVEKKRKSFSRNLDAQILKITKYVFLSAIEKRTVNWFAWLATAAISGYASYLFLESIYSEINLASILGFLSGLIHFQLIVLVALFFRNLLFRGKPGGGIWVWSLLLIGAGTYMADAMLYRLNGMHLVHGLKMLFDGGIQNLPRNLEFTKLSPRLMAMYQASIVGYLLGCFVLAWIGRKISKKWPLTISALCVLLIFIAALGLVAGEQYVGASFKPERQVVKEQDRLPLYLVFREASDKVLTYRAQVKPFVRKDTAIAGEPIQSSSSEVRHIYLFILESIRYDIVTPEIMPELHKFSNESVDYVHGVASGNATHYGWYSIVNSRFPLYWETYRDTKEVMGSASLMALKKAGYTINVHSAKDLNYLQSKRIMFGEENPVYDYLSPHPDIPAPDQDVTVAHKLIEMSLNQAKDEKSVNVVFWDSSHWPYRWPQGMEGLFTPYAGDHLSGVSLGKAQDLARVDKKMIFNRYLNTARFLDILFGQFIEAMKSAGLYDESLIIAVGDHGQQFMEHGFMMHGYSLYNEDIRVPLMVHLPFGKPEKSDVLATQLDVMATILDVAGLGEYIEKASDGVSLLRDDPQHRFAVCAAAALQNTPYLFALETEEWKLFFELDERAPKESRVLHVTSILDLNDQEYIPGEGKEEDYREFVEREFEEYLGQMEFAWIEGQ
jgi:membrane-anchored protein YejM (alkaline phosphatase superfamily)